MAIHEIMELVKRKITEKTSHTYLQKHISNPAIDDNKLLLTISLLLQTKLNKAEIITYATTITLVQIALDTHELVTNDRMQSGNETSRQLTVLAGDLYSGQYYKILADVEDLKMLRYLAEGIKDVNENKIYFYHHNANNIDQVINSVKNIEASLLKKLIHYFDLKEWNSFVEEFLFLNRLEIEKASYIDFSQSILVSTLIEYEEAKQNYIGSESSSILNKYAKWTYTQLEIAMKKLPNMNQQLKEKVDQLIHVNGQQQMYVEEG